MEKEKTNILNSEKEKNNEKVTTSVVNYKIGLDLRFLDINDSYSIFIATLLPSLIKMDKLNKYKLYLDSKVKMKFHESIDVKYISSSPASIKEQFSFLNTLNSDKNNLVIFFNEKKPLFYKGKYILFIKDLKELHYKRESGKIKEFFYNLFFETSLKNATNIVCFEHKTKEELNEKLNIDEDRISVIYPFFQNKKLKDLDLLSSVKVKYSINGEYFIYSGGSGNNKNLSKLISVFKNLRMKKCNVSLVVLDQSVTEDINFRKDVVDAGVVENILFIGDTTLDEKMAFYGDAIGSIFPSLYESFPFSLTESINYKIPILASSIKQIKEIMGRDVAYFSPVSSVDMTEAIITFVENGKQETDYDELFIKYTPEKTARNLLKLIEKV